VTRLCTWGAHSFNFLSFQTRSEGTKLTIATSKTRSTTRNWPKRLATRTLHRLVLASRTSRRNCVSVLAVTPVSFLFEVMNTYDRSFSNISKPLLLLPRKLPTPESANHSFRPLTPPPPLSPAPLPLTTLTTNPTHVNPRNPKSPKPEAPLLPEQRNPRSALPRPKKTSTMPKPSQPVELDTLPISSLLRSRRRTEKMKMKNILSLKTQRARMNGLWV